MKLFSGLLAASLVLAGLAACGCTGNKIEMPTGTVAVPKEPPSTTSAPKVPAPPK
jgi:hypothetical protein